MNIGAPTATEANIAARIERLPTSWFHQKLRIVMGTATFFDSFDALTIAYVLPVFIVLYHMTPAQIGLLIAIGYVGQLIGAIGFGALAESKGRITGATYSIAIFSIMSLACAFSWSFTSILVFRFVQGLGLGGEVPIAAAYINEFAKSKSRGRYFLLYETIFAVGLVVCALVSVVVIPNLGWQWMFVLGAIPALICLFLRRALPESPRWLVSRMRFKEADAVMQGIEKEVSQGGKVQLPEIGPVTETPQVTASWSDLFNKFYRGRTFTVWALWFCCYLVVYGLLGWMPSIYGTVFKLPLQVALQYGMITSTAGLIGAVLCAFFVDIVGRRTWMAAAFILGAVPLLVLWYRGADSATEVLLLASISFGLMNSCGLCLYLYTPEVYPTRMRALGCGIATSWLRIASIIGPFVVGSILPEFGLRSVFIFFGAVAVVGGIVCAAAAIETRGKLLETLSP